MLSLNGNTAPYMLYAYVRIRGIQRKAAEAVAAASATAASAGADNIIGSSAAGDDDSSIADSLLRGLGPQDLVLEAPAELALAKQLMRLEEVLLDVSQDLFPNKVQAAA